MSKFVICFYLVRSQVWLPRGEHPARNLLQNIIHYDDLSPDIFFKG